MPEVNQKLIKNWNDFVFMNFLGIENILNEIERVDKGKFDAKNYQFKINKNPIYVKLVQCTTLNFSNHKSKCDTTIKEIISEKMFSLYTFFLFQSKNYEFAFQFMKDYFTRPYADNKIKMLLIIFLMVKKRYMEAYELFIQVQNQFKMIRDPLKYALLNQAALVYGDKLGKYQVTILKMTLFNFIRRPCNFQRIQLAFITSIQTQGNQN